MVIACGAVSRLITKVRPLDGPEGMGFCLGYDFPVQSKNLLAENKNRIALYFDQVEHGYAWAYHQGQRLNVGIGGFASQWRDPKSSMDAFCRRLGLSVEGIHYKGAMVPLGGVRRRVAKGRLLLAGDSAGFVDPFTGEGIAYAIRSGQIAAETIMEGLAGPASFGGRTVSSRFERRCWDEFGSKLRLSLWFSRLLYRHPHRTFPIFCDDKPLLREFLRMVENQRSYEGYGLWATARWARLYLESLGREGWEKEKKDINNVNASKNIISFRGPLRIFVVFETFTKKLIVKPIKAGSPPAALESIFLDGVNGVMRYVLKDGLRRNRGRGRPFRKS